jgi:hypothetical protein
MMIDPLKDAPCTLLDQDEKTLRESVHWVRGGHPQECWRRLEALARDRSGDYFTLSAVLLTHMIEQHTTEAFRLSALPKEVDVIGAAVEAGFHRSVEARSAELTDILIGQWEALVKEPSGPWLVKQIAGRTSLEDFERLWTKSVDDCSPPHEAVLWAASSQPGFAARLERYLAERLGQLIDRLGLELMLRYIISAALTDTCRDTLLHRILDDYGVMAARLVGDASPRLRQFSSALLRAYYLLRADDPHGIQTQRTLARLLRDKPDAACRDVARLVNDDGAVIDGTRFQSS